MIGEHKSIAILSPRHFHLSASLYNSIICTWEWGWGTVLSLSLSLPIHPYCLFWPQKCHTIQHTYHAQNSKQNSTELNCQPPHHTSHDIGDCNVSKVNGWKINALTVQFLKRWNEVSSMAEEKIKKWLKCVSFSCCQILVFYVMLFYLFCVGKIDSDNHGDNLIIANWLI